MKFSSKLSQHKCQLFLTLLFILLSLSIISLVIVSNTKYPIGYINRTEDADNSTSAQIIDTVVYGIQNATMVVVGNKVSITVSYRLNTDSKEWPSFEQVVNYQWFKSSCNHTRRYRNIQPIEKFISRRSYGEIRCSFETFESDICLQFNVNFSEIIQYHNQSNSSYQAKAIALAKNQYSRSFSWLIKDYAIPYPPREIKINDPLDPKPKLENGSKYIINIDSSSWTHNIPDLQLNCSVIIKSLDLIRANMNWNLLDTTPKDLISCGQKILSCSCEVRLGHLSISQVKAYALYSKSHFSGPSKPTYWDGTGACKVIHNISCHGFEDYYRCNYTQNDTSYYEPISNNTIVLQKDMNDELKVVKILERDRYIGIRSRSDMLRKQTYFINCPIMGIQYQTPDFIKAGGSPINLLPAFVKITNELPNTTSIVPSVPTSSREISQNATGQSITTILKSQAQNYLLAAAFAFGGCLFIYLCWFFYHKFATWIISAKSAEIPRLFEHDSKNKTPVVGKPLSHIYINPHHQDPPRLLQLTVNRQLVGSSQSSANSEEELYGYPDPDLG